MSVQSAKILVTGGCGYVGSHTVLALQAAGAQLIVLDDLSNGSMKVLPNGVAFVQADCADASTLARIETEYKPDAIVHFAGKIVVPESVVDPLPYYLGNTVASRTLIAFAVPRRIPFVFSSTAAVYGEPKDNQPISEDAVTAPINPYGRSKLMTEWMLADAAAAYGLNFGVLRYFNVAGADPEGRAGQTGRQATHLIRVASQVALGLQPHLTIFGDDYPTPDGTCVRDYIHVSDLADAHVLAVQKLLSGGPSFTLNCGYGAGASILEVVAAIENVMGRPVPKIIGPRRPGDPAALLARPDRIQRELDWRPRYANLSGIVASALAWERRWQTMR